MCHYPEHMTTTPFPTTTYTRDPWNPDAPPAARTLPAMPCPICHTHHNTEAQTARCDARVNAQACGCGYDLCGECGAIPGPHLRMVVPGLTRTP